MSFDGYDDPQLQAKSLVAAKNHSCVTVNCSRMAFKRHCRLCGFARRRASACRQARQHSKAAALKVHSAGAETSKGTSGILPQLYVDCSFTSHIKAT